MEMKYWKKIAKKKTLDVKPSKDFYRSVSPVKRKFKRKTIDEISMTSFNSMSKAERKERSFNRSSFDVQSVATMFQNRLGERLN